MVEKLHRRLSFIVDNFIICVFVSKKIVEKWMQLLKQNKMGNTGEALYVSLTCKYKNNEKRADIIKYIFKEQWITSTVSRLTFDIQFRGNDWKIFV